MLPDVRPIAPPPEKLTSLRSIVSPICRPLIVPFVGKFVPSMISVPPDPAEPFTCGTGSKVIVPALGWVISSVDPLLPMVDEPVSMPVALTYPPPLIVTASVPEPGVK